MTTTPVDKDMLLVSMQKLIIYIQSAKQNQHEILELLSRNDLLKTINNFSDDNNKLRKLSLTMMGILLHDDIHLKRKFCDRLQIALVPGKVCLNFELALGLGLKEQRIFQVLDLLKKQVSKQDQKFPMWIMGLKSQVLKIQFIPVSALGYVDPLDHLVGFVIPKIKIQQNELIPSFLTENQKNPISKSKPKFKIPHITGRYSTNSADHRSGNSSEQKGLYKKSLKTSISKSERQRQSREKQSYTPKILILNHMQKQKEIFKQNAHHKRSDTQNSINLLKNIKKNRQHQASTPIAHQEILKIVQPMIPRFYPNTPNRSTNPSQITPLKVPQSEQFIRQPGYDTNFSANNNFPQTNGFNPYQQNVKNSYTDNNSPKKYQRFTQRQQPGQTKRDSNLGSYQDYLTQNIYKVRQK